jgi:hypothetical protein
MAAPDTHFALISSIADPEARLAAFRQYARPSITARLSAELESGLLAFADGASYRLVHVSRLYLAGIAEAWMQAGDRPPCRVLDCDEDDASAYRRLARLYRKWGRDRRAGWAEAEADAFKTMAGRWLPRFDLRLAASAGEARLLGAHAEGADATVVPNAAPANVTSSAPRSVGGGGRRDIVFIGNMSYLPNIDAAMWFASRILPKLRSAVSFPIRTWSATRSDGPRQTARHRRCRRPRPCGAALPARCACRNPDPGRGRHAHQAARKRKPWRSRRGDAVRRGRHRLAFGP